MATKDNLPTKQSRSATIPTREESKIPVSQPSSLGELAASTATEAEEVRGSTEDSNQFTVGS